MNMQFSCNAIRLRCIIEAISRINPKARLNFTQDGVRAVIMDICESTLMRLELDTPFLAMYRINGDEDDSIGIDAEYISMVLRKCNFDRDDVVVVTKMFADHEINFSWSSRQVDYLQTAGDLDANDHYRPLPLSLSSNFTMKTEEYKQIVSNLWGNRVTMYFNANGNTIRFVTVDDDNVQSAVPISARHIIGSTIHRTFKVTTSISLLQKAIIPQNVCGTVTIHAEAANRPVMIEFPAGSSFIHYHIAPLVQN